MRSETSFTNELGNEISISVEVTEDSATIVIAGPTSVCENTLTRLEAAVLLDQLRQALN